MKKGLVVGGILLGCVLLLSGITYGEASLTTKGLVEFQINGDPAGLFSGQGRLESEYSYTVGNWKALLKARFKDSGSGGALSIETAYIEYAAEMATIKMEPIGVEYEIFDLAYGTAKDPGFTITAAGDPLTFTVVVNNSGDPLEWGYGVGADYAAGDLGLGVRYNSTEAYGVQIKGTFAPVALTGQYAIQGDSKSYRVTAKTSVTDTTTLEVRAKNVDDVATYEGWTDITLAEKVTLRLYVKSLAEVLTYYARIGIAF